MSDVTCRSCRQRIVPKSGFGQGWRHASPPTDEHIALPYIFVDPPPKDAAEQRKVAVRDGFLGC